MCLCFVFVDFSCTRSTPFPPPHLCLSVCLSIYLSVSNSPLLSPSFSIYLSVCPSVCLCVSAHLSASLSLSLRLSFCLSICLRLSHYRGLRHFFEIIFILLLRRRYLRWRNHQLLACVFLVSPIRMGPQKVRDDGICTHLPEWALHHLLKMFFPPFFLVCNLIMNKK